MLPWIREGAATATQHLASKYLLGSRDLPQAIKILGKKSEGKQESRGGTGPKDLVAPGGQRNENFDA